MDKIKKIEEKLLKIAVEITKKGDGALFIIGNKVKYSRLLKQKFQMFSLFSKGADKLLKSLACIDGAVIINDRGDVIDYGAMIKNVKPFVGYGTRHAAAITASNNENISILCSEEEKKVKIFRDGKYVMQIDVLDKDVDKNVSHVPTIIETIGIGAIGTIGVTTLAPTLGIALIPGIIIFGGSYYAIRALMNGLKLGGR